MPVNKSVANAIDIIIKEHTLLLITMSLYLDYNLLFDVVMIDMDARLGMIFFAWNSLLTVKPSIHASIPVSNDICTAWMHVFFYKSIFVYNVPLCSILISLIFILSWNIATNNLNNKHCRILEIMLSTISSSDSSEYCKMEGKCWVVWTWRALIHPHGDD